MREKLATFKNSAFIKGLQGVLSSKLFPFISAAVTLLGYYLGWDIVLIYYIGITCFLMLLLLDDLTPIISEFLFMSILISLQNSPSPTMGNSDYYFRPAILAQIIIILVLLAFAVIYRLIYTGIKKKFSLNFAFYCLGAFAAVLLINGLFSKEYVAKNLLYGLIMAASFFGVFSVLKDNLKLDSDGYERIAYSFLAFSVALVVELIVAYITTDGLIVNGDIERGKLIFGWGVYNTFGVFIVMCIPPVTYLAGKKKYGFVYTVYSVFLFVAAFLSCSRQAMVGVAVVYPLCLVILLVKGKNRLANICLTVAMAIAGVVLICLYQDELIEFFKTIYSNVFVDGELNGSGRVKIWREAIEKFKSAPFLGVGFYTEFSYFAKSGLGFIPHMCHNTILQLMSCCGIVGLAVYAVHRVQTVICYFRKVNLERTFIAITILALLIICLFDNHIFNIFPTLIYSCLIAVLVKDGKVKEQAAE